MIDENLINNWFTYHPPVKDQTKVYEAIRSHGREFAHVINNLVPDGPDKTVAIRTLREAVMWANAAVATYDPKDPQDEKLSANEPSPVRMANPYQTTVGGNSRVSEAARHRAPKTMDEAVDGFIAGKLSTSA